ncbi:hypothetical protein Tco_0923908, partial [Tanacetum coccineum]
MSVEDLVVRLRIEDDNKLAHKNTYISDSAKAYMVEHAASSLKSNPKGKDNDKGKTIDNGEKLYMGNSATPDIKGEGDVILKMISGKELKLTNVLYVSEIRSTLKCCIYYTTTI